MTPTSYYKGPKPVSTPPKTETPKPASTWRAQTPSLTREETRKIVMEIMG